MGYFIPLMPSFSHAIELRVRYGDTDQMGTFQNARALDWFECGRTETLRAAGLEYASMEQRGVYLPVIEANLKYLARAKYDDRLQVRTAVSLHGRASLRFDMAVTNLTTDRRIVEGYTLHAVVDAQGKPMRWPEEIRQVLQSLAD